MIVKRSSAQESSDEDTEVVMIDDSRHLFVIFGGTGDLARRKLIPSIYALITESEIGDNCVILGVGSRNMDDDDYRAWTRDALKDAGLSDTDLESWPEENVHFEHLDRDADSLDQLAERIDSIESAHDLPGNRVFYLAVPPSYSRERSTASVGRVSMRVRGGLDS